jgi:hypothetical protein
MHSPFCGTYSKSKVVASSRGDYRLIRCVVVSQFRLVIEDQGSCRYRKGDLIKRVLITYESIGDHTQVHDWLTILMFIKIDLTDTISCLELNYPDGEKGV